MKKQHVTCVKKFLKADGDIKLGYLFGSQATGNTGPLSDYDFAVYFDEKLEKKHRFEKRIELQQEIVKILGTDKVDVVSLNSDVNPSLKFSAINDGILLAEEEPYRVVIEPRIVHEYCEFYARPARLESAMGANGVIVKTLALQIKNYISKVKKYRKYEMKEITEDDTLVAAVERYLYLVTESTINLAETIVAYNKYRKATTLRENFEILLENQIINGELKEKMVGLVGFRNIIAHQYQEIDYNIVYDVLKNKLVDIEEFVSVIESNI